jgi:hypothetical protein
VTTITTLEELVQQASARILNLEQAFQESLENRKQQFETLTFCLD